MLDAAPQGSSYQEELWFECDRGLYSLLYLYICLQLEVKSWNLPEDSLLSHW